MSHEYIEETKGMVTASKAKVFKKCPFLYKLMYKDEIPEPQELDKEDGESKEKKHFMTGTARHFLLENDRDKFMGKYYVSDGLLKAELVEAIIKKMTEGGMDEADIEANRKRLSKDSVLLPKLREEFYGADDWADMSKKMAITRKEGMAITGAYKNVLQQPIWDLGNPHYIKEQRFTSKYRGLPISLKPDRALFRDKTGKYYTKAEMDELFEPLKTLEEKEALVKKLGLKGRIRDYKTTRGIAFLKKELLRSYAVEETEGYGYIFSMGFYFAVIYALYGIECEVYLDMAEMSFPYATQCVSIPGKKLKQKLEHMIKPLLEEMVIAEKSGEYSYPDIDTILEDPEMKKYFWHFPNAIQESIEYLDFDQI